MKLLFVHDHPFFTDGDNIYSGGGLPNTVWKNYLINFDAVTVYARKSNNEKDKKVISSADGVNFVLTSKYSSMSNFLRNILQLKKELSSVIVKSDIVLVRLPSVLGILAGQEALRLKKPIWVEQVGNAKEALDNHGSLLGRLLAPIFDHKNRDIVNKANFISYVTETKLQNDYPSQKNAVTVALSDVILRNVLKESEIIKERFYSENFRIGIIGGFDAKYKGQDVLIKAVQLLPEEIRNNIKINLVGKGDFSWLLVLIKECQLERNIEFIGSLESGYQVDEFLSEISLYVQPSLTEGMPRAIIEAMAMGCPVIGSKVGGIPDVVSPNLLHDKGNVERLSQSLYLLYNDRDLLYAEAFSSVNKALQYTSNKLSEKRNNFYHLMNNKLNSNDF